MLRGRHIWMIQSNERGRERPQEQRWQVYANLALMARLAAWAHAAASIFFASAGWTRVSLKRPSAQTTVKPSLSMATISPILPAIPLGSFAGSGVASRIFTVAPSSFDQAP